MDNTSQPLEASPVTRFETIFDAHPEDLTSEQIMAKLRALFDQTQKAKQAMAAAHHRGPRATNADYYRLHHSLLTAIAAAQPFVYQDLSFIGDLAGNTRNFQTIGSLLSSSTLTDEQLTIFRGRIGKLLPEDL